MMDELQNGPTKESSIETSSKRAESSTDYYAYGADTDETDESNEHLHTIPKKKIRRKRRRKHSFELEQDVMIVGDPNVMYDNVLLKSEKPMPSMQGDVMDSNLILDSALEVNTGDNLNLTIASVVGSFTEHESSDVPSQRVLAEVKTDEMSDTSKAFTSPTRLPDSLPDIIQTANTHDTRNLECTTDSDKTNGLTEREKMIRKEAAQRFSTTDILNYLVEKGSAFRCECGLIFKERQDLYFYHRACHSHVSPLRCAFCNFEAKDFYEFNTHFFRHART